MVKVRIIASLLLTGMLIACFGCASTRRDLSGGAVSWQDPDYVQAVASDASPLAEAIPNAFTIPEVAPQSVPPAGASPFPSSSSVTAGFRTSLVSLRDWCRAVGIPSPVALDAAPSAFAVVHSFGTLRLTIGTPVASWRGMELHLGYAPVLVGGHIYVQSADIKSTVAPLLAGLAAPQMSGSVIVLDPGHGGTDSGTRSAQGASEKVFTLDWARRLQSLLAADGWQVYLTRTSDSDMALSNRVAFADSVGASLFLSLHFNSAPPDKAGIETYCLTPAGVPSTLTRGYADELDLVLPNNEFDAQNLRIAVLIHRALLDVNGGRDRGIRRARFPAVLRGQYRPAVLVEGGFLSNPIEARLISDPAHRQRLAEAIASALRPLAPVVARR